jgi:hypothetical protein
VLSIRLTVSGVTAAGGLQSSGRATRRQCILGRFSGHRCPMGRICLVLTGQNLWAGPASDGEGAEEV